MSKYLYGASVQGIQGFIFKTNKLAEIIGASEIVEQICTGLFAKLAPNFQKENLIIGAAGNIKYIFEEEQDCKDLVKIFPKKVMEMAPGIMINQAVVLINDKALSYYFDKLEIKLKSQRNMIPAPNEIGFMGLERSRRTGGVAFHERFDRNNRKEVICESTFIKRKIGQSQKDKKDHLSEESLFYKISGDRNIFNRDIAFDIEDITKGSKNAWIGVIHADGNALGKIIQDIGSKLANSDFNKSKSAFRDFSKALEMATQKAAQIAFNRIVKEARAENERYPIRPVICGGDDLTVIIRADLALGYAELFLKEFEINSKNEFEILNQYGITDFKEGLTACVGIAYIKESYPLHYGLQLAEMLCNDAKKKVKLEGNLRSNGIPESSLAFYKVQESFVEDLQTLIERTLQTRDKLNYYAGPYTFSELSRLKKNLDEIQIEASKNEKSKAVGKLRKIVSETFKDKSTAVFMIERMREVNPALYKNLSLEQELEAIKNNKTSQLLDLITLHSFNYGNRNN